MSARRGWPSARRCCKKRLDDKLAERLREARAEVDDVVTRLQNEGRGAGASRPNSARRRLPALSTGEVGGLRAEARAALEAIQGAIDLADRRAPELRGISTPAPAAGERVYAGRVRRRRHRPRGFRRGRGRRGAGQAHARAAHGPAQGRERRRGVSGEEGHAGPAARGRAGGGLDVGPSRETRADRIDGGRSHGARGEVPG